MRISMFMGLVRWVAPAALLFLAGCRSDQAQGASGGGGGNGGSGGREGTCPGELVECGGACTDVVHDPQHCGACGTTCPPEQICNEGQCTVLCAGGTTKCGDACIDTMNDPANCGMCSNTCSLDQFCSEGQCSNHCAGDSTLCGSSCVSLMSDTDNCGACGESCAAGESCSAGQCTAILCTPLSIELCYSAPTSTLSVGACKPGTKTCKADGTGYDACVGEVVPVVENCSTPGDDDCDGTTNENCLYPTCKTIRDANPGADSGVYAIDPDGDGNIFQPFEVYCDMVTAGGGWTVLEKSPYGNAIGKALFNDLPTNEAAPDTLRHRLSKVRMTALQALSSDLRIDCRGNDYLLTDATNLFAGEGGPANCYNWAKILYKEASFKGHDLQDATLCTWMLGTSEGCAGVWHIDEGAQSAYNCNLANYPWTGAPITTSSADSFAVDPGTVDDLGQECHTPGAVRHVMVR